LFQPAMARKAASRHQGLDISDIVDICRDKHLSR